MCVCVEKKEREAWSVGRSNEFKNRMDLEVDRLVRVVESMGGLYIHLDPG